MAYTTINKSSLHFTTKLYTGNDSGQTISGVGFKPDWTWLKSRVAGEHHVLTDAARGVNKQIRTNGNVAQGTLTTQLTGFTSDGFSLGAGDEVNNGNANYTSWNWKANGQGSSNTAGSINTTYTSANTTSGVSIVKWNGNGSTATIGHGLGKVPKMIMVKSLANTTTWMVQHASLGNAKEIYLNNTTAAGNSTAWNSTTPTSTVFSVTGGGGDGVNASGAYIAYCFADIQGFSKMGFYDGNGSAEGVFEYLGFKPAFLLIKNTTATEAWFLYDNKRGYNGSMGALFPDETAADAFANNIDFLSNGFKLRTGGAILNGNTTRYIYMAFAESPFVSTNNAAATAR